MRNINILLFILSALSISAQTVTKAFVLGQDNTNYFEVIRVTQDDSSYVETSALIGPVSALASDQADKIEQDADRLALAAYTVSFTKRDILAMVDIDDDIVLLAGASPLAVIQARYLPALLAPGWTIDDGNGALDVVFSENQSGVLKYNISGGANNNAKIYSNNLIRLNNFPTVGVNTEFFLSDNGQRYFSLPNRAYILKKP